MIIDKILDRKDGNGYYAHEFYCYCNGNGKFGNNIARAMDGGTNEDVCRELCDYIKYNGYDFKFLAYINSQQWI